MTDTSMVTEPPKTPVEIALASIGLPAQPPVPTTKRTLTSEGFSMLYTPATWAEVSPMLVSVNHLSSTKNHNFHADRVVAAQTLQKIAASEKRMIVANAALGDVMVVIRKFLAKCSGPGFRERRRLFNQNYEAARLSYTPAE
jgi:hypothetical protein